MVDKTFFVNESVGRRFEQVKYFVGLLNAFPRELHIAWLCGYLFVNELVDEVLQARGVLEGANVNVRL